MKILNRILSWIIILSFLALIGNLYSNQIRISKVLNENREDIIVTGNLSILLYKLYMRKPLYILYEQSSLDVWEKINKNEDIKRRMDYNGQKRKAKKK